MGDAIRQEAPAAASILGSTIVVSDDQSFQSLRRDAQLRKASPLAIAVDCEGRQNCTQIQMSLSGLEKLAQIGEFLESLLGGNAEYNAVIAELLSVVEAWSTLSATSRAKILKLVVAPPK